MSIEETQYVYLNNLIKDLAHNFSRYNLRAKIRSLGPRPTTSQKNEVADRRAMLLRRIASHHEKLEQFLPSTPSTMQQSEVINDGEDAILEEDEESESVLDQLLAPERIRIKMPSTLGSTLTLDPNNLCAQEEELRVSQAEQALAALRLSMGEAAVHYRLQGRSAQRGKNTKTRSYEQAKKAIGEVHKHWRIYNRARTALLHLPKSGSWKTKYKIITKDQLKISPDIDHENRVGQRSSQLAWFWLVPDASGEVHDDISEWHEECKWISFWGALYVSDKNHFS